MKEKREVEENLLKSVKRDVEMGRMREKDRRNSSKLVKGG